MSSPQLPTSREQAERLRELLGGRSRTLILIHDHPDPDAMAGAFCVYRMAESLDLGEPRILHSGFIGRASNRLMVDALEMPLTELDGFSFQPADAVVMVDTQPGFGNNTWNRGAELVAVIDHHPPLQELDAPLVDIREHYGAVTSILTEYLMAAGVEIGPRLATAICYGISSETQDLGREAVEPDIAAFLEAFPLSDQRMLGRLRHPVRSPMFFGDLVEAVQAARVVQDTLVCHIGQVSVIETVAEMADMLVAVEGIRWVLCTGVSGGRLVLSLRTTDRSAEAGDLLRDLVPDPREAGGHGMMAGGSIALNKGGQQAHLEKGLEKAFLNALGRGGEAQLTPLLELPGMPVPVRGNQEGG